MLNLEEFWKLRLMFPELTESQFQVLMLYALGANSENIAEMLGRTVVAIKKTLQRIRQDLAIDKMETARLIYHSRIHTAMMAPDDFPQKFYETMSKKRPMIY
ncbi:sigma factor-like helix-turn-helix DNA-binding protein [Edwardsiella tarda]|uniref:sigma factor-like helix-turn-helix DNA-binding protein n=1 Tax=Edwardsiella tarda TaxID=636 RepID=UPI000D51D100|nr:hypothetical protein DCF76_16755 [Edwardsiella tarda]